ncbi:unnamed protein product [Adineta steineri]|uniref:MYND-type domain-containing protein n=1 Tax=Adineta steineri TaxID=433720 RepID=A0A815EFH7_9BILA|nr:unnamed protein product [Adineta steineri]CAF3590929.1 unnamed protein product [Adineta steineri]
MAKISAEVRNYFKLDLLLRHSFNPVRQIFLNRFPQFNGGQLWNDTNICGQNYVTNILKKNKKINLTPTQRIPVENGQSSEWDLSTLTNILLFSTRPTTLSPIEIQQLDQDDKLLEQLKDIRNKLAHHGSKSVDNTEFNQLWTDLKTILVALGVVDTEIDKLKDDSIFDPSSQVINEDNVKEALRLNSLATQAHKDGQYSEAITFFTKATVLSGVANSDRAIFFSNMASSRLALYEQQVDVKERFEVLNSMDERYRALKDAKQARNLWNSWWKGHFRVGKVYAVLNEHEKAINSFERALALDPTNNEIKIELDKSRSVYMRQLCYDHLNPEMRPMMMSERLTEMQQRFGTSLEELLIPLHFIEQIDPAVADLTQGHRYEHGDVSIKQDYEVAARYFAKAASQNNAEGLYNLARLTDFGLGVKKDPCLAQKLYEQAARQPPMYPKLKTFRNPGVAAAEHALALRYANGIVVHKNLQEAVYWYERAVANEHAPSANNLGIIYNEGIGVEKNLDKAETLFEMAAKNGCANAMQSLAKMLLDSNELPMAKIWFNRACEAGNIYTEIERITFEKLLQEKQQEIDRNSISIIKRSEVKTEQTHAFDYDILSEHAKRGSITARKMCNAREHFQKAISIIQKIESLTEDEENIFIHELSLCFRIECIITQFSTTKIHQKIEETVDRILHRCSTNNKSIDAASQLDEDVRICYAVLHMESLTEIVQFLASCQQKYPKSVYLFQLNAIANCSLRQYETVLYSINNGLDIEPNNYELLYHRAVALRFVGNDMKETIKAYETFLVNAPKDHRKVPEAYYAMANCYFVQEKRQDITNNVKKTFQQGIESEKCQLPCFLPYKTASKSFLEQILNENASCQSVKSSTSADNNKSRLTDPKRIATIVEQRRWQNTLLYGEKRHSASAIVYTSREARIPQRSAKSLIGLKPITIREMNPIKDHVYDKYVLSVTIIGRAYSWQPSIHLIIEDEHLDCIKICIYGFPNDDGGSLVSQRFRIGAKMNIINPYLRIPPSDRIPIVRVDDFLSIIMQNESEYIINMCRCCGKENASQVCGLCKQAFYCSKECQTIDWKLYEHKLICRKE